jgi:hypothetical protein
MAAFDRQLALMNAGEWPPEGGETHSNWRDDDVYSDDWIAPEDDPPGREAETSHNWAE